MNFSTQLYDQRLKSKTLKLNFSPNITFSTKFSPLDLVRGYHSTDYKQPIKGLLIWVKLLSSNT